MTKDPAFERTLSAATLSLLACGGCVAVFLPPLNERLLHSTPLVIALGLGVAVSLVLHLVYVGLGARQLGRRPLAWVLLALLSFPIASIVVLSLLHWQAAGEKAASGGNAASPSP